MTEHDLNYSTQDRGDEARYQKYLSGMDSVIVEKIASASAYFPHKSGYTIVDVGMASGTGTYILAVLFPNCNIIGVDINPTMVKIANETYQLPNLKYIVDDGERLANVEKEKIIGFFNCSSIHHITSFNNYNPNKAYLTIKRQTELLQEGGVIVIRDFVKPEAKDVFIEFAKDNEGKQNSSLLEEFSKTARSLSPENEKGFPLQKVSANIYKLDFADALEFVRRKDYLTDWEVELQEEYGYYTQREFEEIFIGLGLRTIVSSPIYNPWIIKNRYQGKFTLTDLDNNLLGDPETNYVIAAEKVVKKGLKLSTIRQLPIQTNSFIHINSYKNVETEQVFNVAQRPFPVVDLLPFYKGNDGSIKVIAKHGYPRPIINQLEGSRIIDKKKFSGYFTECLTAMKGDGDINEFIVETLKTRARINHKNITAINSALKFYSSPGGIDEMVDSFNIEIKNNELQETGKPLGSYSGFKDSGEIRSYDAIQLLKSIQVGAVPDLRLELGLYHLFKTLDIEKGKWLGDLFDPKLIDTLSISALADACKSSKKDVYEKVNQESTFLTHKRTKFYEDHLDESTSILEYVEPTEYSANTVLIIPIYKHKNQVYIGIEHRVLPVPNIHENNALLLAVPAFRVTRDVQNYTDLERFIMRQNIGQSKAAAAVKLGEKYFPSPGITPEQVYPYVVALNHPGEELFWISLKELLSNTNKLKDGHLLVALYRLSHMLGI